MHISYFDHFSGGDENERGETSPSYRLTSPNLLSTVLRVDDMKTGPVQCQSHPHMSQNRDRDGTGANVRKPGPLDPEQSGAPGLRSTCFAGCPLGRVR